MEEDLLKAIESGAIKASQVLQDLPTKEDESTSTTTGKLYSNMEGLPDEIKNKS